MSRRLLAWTLLNDCIPAGPCNQEAHTNGVWYSFPQDLRILFLIIINVSRGSSQTTYNIGRRTTNSEVVTTIDFGPSFFQNEDP